MELFDARCKKALAPIPDMAYYNCVALCALDAVFSIRTRYSTVKKILNRFCEHYDIPLMAKDPHTMPSLEHQLTVSKLVEKMGEINAEDFANIICNKQWTSTKGRNRIRKAEAFLRYLEVFKKYQIDTFQDVNTAFDKDDNFKKGGFN